VYPRLRQAFGGQVAYTVSGASPLDSGEAHFFRGAGIPVLEGYGLTETAAPCTVNTPTHTRVGSVGIPIPGTTVRVAEDGEILVKGIGVFRGYHANQAANAEAFVDGFFRTGDLGELDPQGFLTVTGRKKDLLVTAGGKNVAPGPLEEKIRAHQLVAHAVVVGDGKPFVSALVTLDPEGLDNWHSERGLPPRTVQEVINDPQVMTAVQEAVDQANLLVSKAESVRRFAVLDAEFTVESGHLTPSLKVKRAAVVNDYQADIAGLYA
jgi:long-chain acyl-CoA synthetase